MGDKIKAGAVAALAAVTSTVGSFSAVAQDVPNHSVLELRQYKMTPGSRAKFIELFDRNFVESQEAVGATLIGQFADVDRPDRFTWIRSFENMETRKAALNAFYFGPVWKAHKDVANPMLDDNDNVLLLRPAWPGSAFPSRPGPRPNPGEKATPNSIIIVRIHYLWKDPGEGFTSFFQNRIAPRLQAAGLPVLGAYVMEKSENTFPRLPVRAGEKVFVWFTRSPSVTAYEAALKRIENSAGWRGEVAAKLADFEERSGQTLRLKPTPRSALR